MITEKIHRGNFLKAKLEEKQIPIAQLADALGIERSTVYKWFPQENLDIDKLKRACDFLKVDLREYFDNIELIYGFVPEKTSYQKKYYELLEKYADLQETHALYIKKFGDLASQNRDKSE